MFTRDFYEARAAECAQEAANAPLVKVKEQALRSQAAWLGMASWRDQIEAMRASREAAKKNTETVSAEVA